jgi:hypothetical protein
MGLAGTYSCTLQTPLGKKEGTLTVSPAAEGESFTGTLSNSLLGTMQIEDGTIDGDMLLCRLEVTSPKAMTVDCEVIIDGDNLNGFVTAGMFGELKLTGHRIG